MKRTFVNLAVCSTIAVVGATATAGVVVARRVPTTPQPSSDKIVNIGVQILDESTVEDFFTLTGTLVPWQEILLSAQTAGNIEWKGVEDGDTIAAGAELMKIDRVSTEVRLDQARTEYELARLELERVEELREKGISSHQILDRARVDRDVVRANVRTKEIELKESVVHAPFDGIVDKILQDCDEFVGVGTPLLSVIQVHKLKMVVGIADQDIPFFSVGDPVTVLVDAYKDSSFHGTIHRIANRAEMSTHTFEAEIELDNSKGNLRPGMIARAVLVRKRYPNSITVPVFSVITDQQKHYVFVEKDGRAHRRDVVVAFHQGNFALIDYGLAAGDRLVVSGHRNLRDKSHVDVLKIVP